jgi:poly(A) polymerase
LFKHLFPLTDRYLTEHSKAESFIRLGLRNTDVRIAEGKPVTPAFLFAILLWHPVLEKVAQLSQMSFTQALQVASSEVISAQIQSVSIPRRFSVQVREIWMMQAKLQKRHGKRAERLLEQARFRAGYDFLLLRSQSDEPELSELANWWTEFQQADEATRASMQRKLSGTGGGKRKNRRRRSAG